MFGHAGKQLELRHGEPQGGVGRAGGAAHGPPQPGHDIGQLLADRLPVDLFMVYPVLACVFLRGRYLGRRYLGRRYLGRRYLGGRYLGGRHLGGRSRRGRYLRPVSLSDLHLTDPPLWDAALKRTR